MTPGPTLRRRLHTGNIAGIPKRAAHPEQAWALLKYLTTDDRAMVALSNGLRNVPTTASSAKSPDLKPDDRFETFVKMYGNPNTTTTPVTAAGSANQELFNSFVDKWQAGRVGDLQGGLDGVAKQIDDQLANAEGQGRDGDPGAGSVAPAGSGARATPPAFAPRGVAPPGTVLAFMSPWIVGFTVFFGYPLITTVYLSFTHYDLLQPSRWIGTANYHYLFTQDKQIWPAVRTRSGWSPIAVPLKVLFAFGVALMLTRRGAGSACSGRSSTCRRWRRPSRPRSASSTSSTPRPGRSASLRSIGIDGPLWFNDPTGPSRRSRCCSCGASAT